MSWKFATICVLSTALLAALALPAAAEDNCETCGEPMSGYAGECSSDPTAPDFIGVSVFADDTEDNRESFDQYGLYPSEWASSGKVHFNANCLASERFEIRWEDVSTANGRAWTRLALWPMTIESESFISRGYGWDSFNLDPDLVSQRIASDRLRMRWHEGSLEPLLVSYSRLEVTRRENTTLGDYTVERLSGQYNFGDASDNLRGSIRQTGTAFDTTQAGLGGGRIDSTLLRLDAPLSDKLDAYGRLTYSRYDYDYLPDSNMTAHDAKIGLRYDPNCELQLEASYRAKSNPDDNTVSSHVQGFNEYGLAVDYMPSDNTSIEAGYKHRSVDYASLNMQDASVFSLLRGTALATPADVAGATTVLSPSVNNTWFDWRQCLGEDVVMTNKVEFSSGDSPGTNLTLIGSPGLFYDENVSRTHGLTYTMDANNQLGVFLRSQDSSNNDRGSSFTQRYLEGSWTHCLASGRYLSLAYRDTTASLDVEGIADEYSTDDRTYVATYSQDNDCFSYALNLSVSDGTGAQEYTQTGAGADFSFKELGPVGMTIDWYDRAYSNFAGLDASALTVGVNYKIEF